MKETLLAAVALAAAALLHHASAAQNYSTNPPYLNLDAPIYLGHIFMPPSMTFIAYLPPPPPPPTHPHHVPPSNYFCRTALDITASELPFTIGGLEDVKMHEYFSAQAWLSVNGRRFADCVVTPESGGVGLCGGKKEEGDKFVGVGVRVWSCFIRGAGRWGRAAAGKEGVGEGEGALWRELRLTDERATATATGRMEARVGSPVLSAYIPGATG